MPPVTRVYTTACVITTLAVQLEIVSPFQLYFNPLLILRLPLKFYQVMKMYFKAISSVETCHYFPVFWNFWVQLSLQHDLHLSILQNVRGGQFQRKIRRFCNDVCFWSSFYDHFCILCESPLPWPGIHDHAGLCLGQEESLHQNELLWFAYIQCSLSSLGAARILSPLGQFCLS